MCFFLPRGSNSWFVERFLPDDERYRTSLAGSSPAMDEHYVVLYRKQKSKSLLCTVHNMLYVMWYCNKGDVLQYEATE